MLLAVVSRSIVVTFLSKSKWSLITNCLGLRADNESVFLSTDSAVMNEVDLLIARSMTSNLKFWIQFNRLRDGLAKGCQLTWAILLETRRTILELTAVVARRYLAQLGENSRNIAGELRNVKKVLRQYDFRRSLPAHMRSRWWETLSVAIPGADSVSEKHLIASLREGWIVALTK